MDLLWHVNASRRFCFSGKIPCSHCCLEYPFYENGLFSPANLYKRVRLVHAPCFGIKLFRVD